jgi:integrase
MSIYKRKDSDIFWVNISAPGQPRIRRSTGTSDRQEAQRLHDEIKAKSWSAPKLNGKTWGKAVISWTEVEERSESELLSLAKFARHFSDRRLSEVTPESVHKALSFCKTAGTYTRYRTMIAAILNLSGAKVNLLVKKDKKKKARAWITREQWEKLYGYLPVHQRAMALFAVATGLRQSNVLTLTWSRVDFNRRLVWIEAEDTKGDEAIAVPLSDEALEALHSVHGKHKEWVFTFRGKPIKDIKTGFQLACARAGLRGFTWHGLRHTWATWHVQNDTPLGVLKDLGAWSDLRMVMTYAHHTPGHVASFANNTRKK